MRRFKKLQPKEYIQIGSVIIGGLAFGMIFQLLPLGQIAIIIYGIIALMRRIPSRITFTLALIILGLTAALAIFGQIGIITQNFATYIFLLLIVGVVSAALELRLETKAEEHLTRKEARLLNRKPIMTK